MEAVLRSDDYDLLQARSGEEAIEMASVNDLAVIVMDVQMPGIDGFAAASEIQKRGVSPPIIFITALHRDEMYVYRGYEVGAVDYLYKPFDPYVLRSKVAVFVKLHRATRSIQRLEQAEAEQRLAEERVRWEAERLREDLETQRRLAELSAMFRLLVEGVADYGIFMVDLEGRILSWNEGAKKIFRYEGNEIIGQPFSVLFLPEDIIAGAARLELSTAEARERAEDERWHLRKDGSRFWASGIVAPIRDSDGVLLGYAKLLRDNTERRMAEKKLRDTMRALEKSNEELLQFAHIASHDLQEPLNKVLLFGDLLRSATGPDLDEQARSHLDKIQQASRRMKALISALLDYSRISDRPSSPGRVDLNGVVRDVISDVEAAVTRSGARVDVGPLPIINGQAVQMRQLFHNLIMNALKFSRKDVPPRLRIVSAPVENDYFEIMVQDNGVGFDEKYRDKIFQPFGRLHPRDQFEGTGIGLSICRKVAENHGGTITASSREDEGSTFVIRLPASLILSGAPTAVPNRM